MSNEISVLLQGKLDNKFVESRKGSGGKMLSYIKGSRMEMIANEIFKNKWETETLEMDLLFQRTYEKEDKYNGGKKTMFEVAYSSKVKITVIIDGVKIIKMGTGFGSGQASESNMSSAYELAIKEAETDARKRALKTLGTAFGLELWDTKIDIAQSYEKDLKTNETFVLAKREIENCKTIEEVKNCYKKYKGSYKNELAKASSKKQKEIKG